MKSGDDGVLRLPIRRVGEVGIITFVLCVTTGVVSIVMHFLKAGD